MRINNVNIVIPMAGRGSRFAIAGYEKPKPFIDVSGKIMIERVLENLNFDGAKFYLLVRSEHLVSERLAISKIANKFNVEIINVDILTEGTACTVLHARSVINNSIPLIIANSDQIVNFDIKDFINKAKEKNLDGSIVTFSDVERNPKWSFAKVDKNGIVEEVQEKNPISEYATVGIYYFNKGSEFVNGAVDMIIANDRVNNEFYTCPVYNYLINKNLKIGIYNISKENMFGLGTPEDLMNYINLI